MKIHFLGTSASWPLPRLGCSCRICKSSDYKDRRTRSQLLINDKLLLDAGPDTYLHLRKIDPTKLTACIITHKHWDHAAGIADLEKIYNLKKPIQIIRTSGLAKKLKVNGLKIDIFPVEHGKTPTVGVKITQDKKSVVYAPDIRTMPAESAKLCKNSNVLIIGGSSLSLKGRAKGHETIQEGILLAKKLGAKQVYFTHIGHATGKHGELENFVKNKGSNIHIAFDNLIVEI